MSSEVDYATRRGVWVHYLTAARVLRRCANDPGHPEANAALARACGAWAVAEGTRSAAGLPVLESSEVWRAAVARVRQRELERS